MNGNDDVAEVLQVGHRVEPVGAAGMAGDEDELAVLRARRAPLEVMLGVGGLAVLVGAEEADVEVVAGILEVVGIAAEEGDVELGREDEPDVGVLLVRVEVVLPALIERDHVAAQAGLVVRFLLDRAPSPPRRATRRGVVVHARLDRRVHPVGHVLDRDQHVQLEVGGLHLLGAGFGRRKPSL